MEGLGLAQGLDKRRSKYLRRHTKIVCTIGPASGSPVLVERLLRAGMNVARLNLSHGTHQEHERYVKTIRTVSQRLGLPVAILMDLPGPKYRTGALKGGSAFLKRGAQVVLTSRAIAGDENEVPVNLPRLSQEVKPGDTVLLDDGAMQLRVQGVRGDDVLCRVVVGGTLTPERGVVVPGMPLSGPYVTEELRKNLAFAVEQQPDYLALSFVGHPSDVEQVRALVEGEKASIPLIAKIERGQAVAHLDRVLAVSDGIMVARGDLGVDIPLERVPLVQKNIIRKCNWAGKPVITATQMLESMVKAASPTRAEVTDVANAILDGTDAIMLSAETSIGLFPVQAVKMMAQVAKETEAHLPYEHWLWERGAKLERQTDEAISYDACYTANRLGAVAIVAFTHSGSTARRVSQCRPRVPILALTPDEVVGRGLLLFWGTQPFQIAEPSSVEELFALGARLPRELGLARPGDLVVITGGIPIGVPGTTNLLKVERIA